jgi:hypothetical protein
MIHVPQSYVQIPVGHNILISFWHDPSSLCFFAFGGFVVSLSASTGFCRRHETFLASAFHMFPMSEKGGAE